MSQEIENLQQQIKMLQGKLLKLSNFSHVTMLQVDKKYVSSFNDAEALAKEDIIKNLKEKLISNFISNIISDYEHSKTSEEKRQILEKLSKYPDLLKIHFEPKTFLGRLLHRKENLRIDFLKDKDVVFDEMYPSNSEKLQARLQSLLGYSHDILLEKIGDISAIIKKTKSDAREEYKNMNRLRQEEIYDADGDFLPDHLALVHATRFKPRKNADGLYELGCLANDTNFLHPRNTVHFAINHLVESHLEGSWKDVPYVIIVPFKQMINQYRPMAIQSIDTFFELGIDERLTLPADTHLIEPNDKKIPEGILWVFTKNRTLYKDKNFTEADKNKLDPTILPTHKEYNNDAFWSDLLRQQVVQDVCKRLGYGIQNEKFYARDTETARKIANMGRKMHIPSDAGGALHSMMALSGINRLGCVINDVYRNVKLFSELTQGILTYDPSKHSFSDGNDRYDYGDIKCWIRNLREAEKFNSYMQKKCEKFDIERGVTPKELAIYNKWKEMTQKRITKMLPIVEQVDKILDFPLEKSEENERMDRLNQFLIAQRQLENPRNFCR